MPFWFIPVAVGVGRVVLTQILSKGGSLLIRGGKKVVTVASNNPKISAITLLAGGGIAADVFFNEGQAFQATGNFLDDLTNDISNIPILATSLCGCAGGYILSDKNSKTQQIILPLLGLSAGYLISKSLFDEETTIPSTDEELSTSPNKATTEHTGTTQSQTAYILQDSISIVGENRKILWFIDGGDAFKVSYDVKNRSNQTISVWCGLSFEEQKQVHWQTHKFKGFLDIAPKKVEIGPGETKNVDFGWFEMADGLFNSLHSRNYYIYVALWEGYDSANNLMVEPQYSYFKIAYSISV